MWLVGTDRLGYFRLQSQTPRTLTAFFAQEERLWFADPKAINHILRNSCTVYRKQVVEREFLAVLFDRGLSWADGSVVPCSVYLHVSLLTIIGEVHKRQRKAMAPTFGLAEAKGLLPYFAQSATKVRSASCQS